MKECQLIEIHKGSSPIESFSWFDSLYRYSRPQQKSNGNGNMEDDMDSDDESPLEPDGDLVAEMVSKAVVPQLIKAFEAGVYDPYSAAQTRRAVDLADVVAELTGKDSRKFSVGIVVLISTEADWCIVGTAQSCIRSIS